MWILSETGFVSLVLDRTDPTKLQVRARIADDIRALLPDADVATLPGADYAHRAVADKLAVADRLHDLVMGISYESHVKETVAASAPPHPGRLTALYKCWGALAALQDYAPYSTEPRAGGADWGDDE